MQEPSSIDLLERDPDRLNSWMLFARCRSEKTENFFPSDGVGVKKAIQFCSECPVRLQCLEYAIDQHVDHGVWGGASERERRRIRRSRDQQSEPGIRKAS